MKVPVVLLFLVSVLSTIPPSTPFGQPKSQHKRASSSNHAHQLLIYKGDIETSKPPGLRENSLFECDPSVQFWREYDNTTLTAQSNLARIAAISGNFVQRGPDGFSYWVGHSIRTLYFLVHAALIRLLILRMEGLPNKLKLRASSPDLQYTASNEFFLAVPFFTATKILLANYVTFEKDYEQICEGRYRQPWDMSLRHRQSNPLNLIIQTSRFVKEAAASLPRQKYRREDDKKIQIDDSESPGLYPDYYSTAFHWQTDGWMSKQSADVYQISAETFFIGRYDAMQRMCLPPITEYAKDRESNEPLKVLEVGCGTGRLMTFIRDNLPLDAKCTALDLSPYYLDAARENDEYWRTYRREEEMRKENYVDGDEIAPLNLVHANAEDLPFESETFDIAVCAIMYHELPQKSRSMVSAEMARVLKKGGMLVFMDATQIGDRPMLDVTMTPASADSWNEPFFANYVSDNLPTHFLEEGLTPLTKIIRGNVKCLVFVKP